MRPFYLTMGRFGNYRIRLVDMESGLTICDRSAKTSDKKAAERIAWGWVQNGLPEFVPKRTKRCTAEKATPKKHTETTTPKTAAAADELALLELLAKKHGLTLSQSAEQKTAQSLPMQIPAMAQPLPESAAPVAAEHIPEKITDADLPLKLSPGKFNAGKFNGVKLCDFLLDFWTEEKSPYWAEQKAHRKDLNGTHCHDMRGFVPRYYKRVFGDSTVDSLTTDVLNAFFMYLAVDKGLKSSTVNKALNVAAVAFKFYTKKKIIAENPMQGIERFGADKVARGILTRAEVEKLFSFEWADKQKQLANMLAAFTGMRAGEVSALRYCDVYDDRIYVNRNWSVVDGEKDPKRHENRWVVCPPEICTALRVMAQKNKVFTQDGFVFWSWRKGGVTPMLPDAWVRALDEALEHIGITSEMRKARHIDFHSWRHFYATEISERVQMGTAQKMLGLKDASTTAIYASHESEAHMAAVQDVMAELGQSLKILPFQLVA